MYDFQNLSFDDFEKLTRDLLQKLLGVRLESFRTGKDDGIDLRYAPTDDDALVVQCKRYDPKAFPRLLKDITRSEKPKILRLKPSRYLLSTSCLLNPENKKMLKKAIDPFCLSTGDIFGLTELNAMIRENPDIERRHFKLWLGSTAVLHQVLHAGIFNYSAHEVERLRRDISKYVVHDGFYRALDLLDDAHHCIIVGIPGIGKTTAARLLLAHHLREGFEVVSVSGDIEEAWKIVNHVDSSSKLIVYYDDFLGQMTFEQKLSKNEDRRLLDLMEHCRSSKNTRFVLTTRDYLFDQALRAYEPLGRTEEKLRCSSVKLSDYDSVVRAKLLANHLQFSEVGISVLQELVDSRAYEKIIQHRNFLPRVIEQICEQWTDSRSSDNFAQRALATLDDPIAVWKRPFAQLTFEARLLIYALASLKGMSESSRLEESWRALSRFFNNSTDRTYLEVLKEAEGSFTHSQVFESSDMAKSNGTMVGFINPSAREFAHYDLISKHDVLEAVFVSAKAFDQLVFWREIFPVQSSRGVLEKIKPFSVAMAKNVSILISIIEPATIPHWQGGRKIVWSPMVPQISRLNTIFDALIELDKEDLIRFVVDEMFAHNLSKFAKLVKSNDLTWLPEVLKAILKATEARGDFDQRDKIFSELGVEGWMSLPHDMTQLRYVWQASSLVVDLVEQESLEEIVLDGLISRVREISEEISQSTAADEISEVADELQMLITLTGLYSGPLSEDLDKLRTKEREARDSEQDEEEVEVAPAYRSKNQVESDQQIAEIFKGLLSQTKECESVDEI